MFTEFLGNSYLLILALQLSALYVDEGLRMWEIMHATYMKDIARLPIGIAHLHCETYLLHGKIKFVTQIFFCSAIFTNGLQT